MSILGEMKNMTLLGLLAIILSGCSPPGGAPAEGMVSPEMVPTPQTMLEEPPSDQEAPQVAAWLQAPLTDVRSGEEFTLADFQGRVVLVEMMAVWCPKCLDQQLYMSALQQQVDNPDLVLVSLDIDPTESAEFLQSYVERQGFTWSFALAPPEVAREIASLYGNQFLNPPSTPMLLIDREGIVHPLEFGIKNEDALLRSLENYL